MLLDRLRRTGMFFDIGCDVHRRDQPDVIDVILRPRQKLRASTCVSFAGVQVAAGLEKFEELGGVSPALVRIAGTGMGVAPIFLERKPYEEALRHAEHGASR